MLRNSRGFVSAFLPLLPMAFCVSCGSGGSSESAPSQVAAPSVASANKAPSITAVGDAYARVGETYEFLPSAHDPDGDALSFSATNLPTWASIDSRSGRVSGTPAANDQGVYESITITVADVAGKAVTAPFSITVVGNVGSGVATLRWEMPPSKVDGSPLDDLAGYRILYGRSSSDLDRSVLISEPGTTSYEFTTLESGIWYFAVVAVNAGGLEGPPTVTTSKSI
jgi:hypothetical protein